MVLDVLSASKSADVTHILVSWEVYDLHGRGVGVICLFVVLRKVILNALHVSEH